MKFPIADLKDFARHWLQKVSPDDQYGIRASLRDAKLLNIVIGEMAYFAYQMLNQKEPVMNTQEKLANIEEAILALPENEITSFLISITNKVQARRIAQGTVKKKELDLLATEHEKLHDFIQIKAEETAEAMPGSRVSVSSI